MHWAFRYYNWKTMKQYLVIAKDGKDDAALQRRLNARKGHLAGAAALKANGNFVLGGAMLNKDGEMEGSVLVLQFGTETDFEAWYANEPYIVQGVWQEVEVKPFKVANFE
mgnify:CR=1 FL=1